MEKRILVLMLFIAACNDRPIEENKKNIPAQLAAEISDTTSKKQWESLELSMHRIDVIMRCRDLDDSANQIYIQYTQGNNTYKNYLRARKRYIYEYDSVYVPLCDKLGIKPEGGKK